MPDGDAVDELTERVVASRSLYRGRYLTLRIDTIERADGSRADREVVGHPGAVAILALDEDGRVLLVRQFRVPAGRTLLEVPAGTLDVEPLSGAVEDHAGAARRELEEETGYRAATWRLLTSFWTAPGFATELMHLWLATDLRAADDERLGPDDDERLRLERLPWPDAVAAVERGEIADAKSIVALLWLDRLKASGSLAAGSGTASEPAARATFTPGAGEYIAASMEIARLSTSGRVIGLIALALALLSVAMGDAVAAIAPVTFGLAFLSGAICIPIVWFAVWRHPDLLRQPTEFLATAQGIDYRNALAQSHAAWPMFKRIRETGRYLFLETGVQTFFVPKRVLTPADIETVRRLAAEAGFGADGRRRTRPTP